MQNNASKLTQIDGLRGIAAILLATSFHQYILLGQIRTGPFNDIPVLGWLHVNGWTMVDLFFVVSGFVFSHVYLRNGTMRKDVTFLQFAKARFARLYPLHIATLFLVAGILLFGTPFSLQTDQNDLKHFILNIFMLQQSGLNEAMSFNNPSWSVSVEVLCYILFYAAARQGGRFLFIFAIGAIYIGTLMADYSSQSTYYIGRGIAGFFAGYTVWRFKDALLRKHWAIYLLVCIITLSLNPGIISYGVYLSLTAWPALLLLALKTDVLSAPPFRWLGDRSYSIYLLHVPVYYAVSIFIFDNEPVAKTYWLPVLFGTWASILVVAHFSYIYFEWPARKAIRNWRFEKPQYPARE